MISQNNYALGAIMHDVSVRAIYMTASDMQKVRNIIASQAENYPNHQGVSNADWSAVSGIFAAMREEIVKFDCRASLATVDRIFSFNDSGTLTYGNLIALADELDGRIRDELITSYAFSLTAGEAALYDPAEPLIDATYAQRFESALYDTEECAKCLALARSTASVFHAMRVLERGISSIASCLGIPDPVKPSERNWGKMLGRIDDAIKAKWPDTKDREHGDGHLFESLYATLSAIRNPWRNGTMHPARKYTQEEAGRIVNAVGNFMRELNTRCDENGDPKA